MSWHVVFLHLSALAMVGLAIGLSADEPARFLNLPGALVVFGGSLAALLASYKGAEIRLALQQLRSLTEAEADDSPTIERLARYSTLWSRHDLRRIEKELEQEQDPLIHRGMQLLLTRFSPAEIRQVLEQCLAREQQSQQMGVRVMHSLATFAPAFGMLGTLIGLVNLLLGMQQPGGSELGFHWAIALVTTFYGILLSNLLFRPLAIKLEHAAQAQYQRRRLVVEGLGMVAEKRSPALLRECMSSMADPLQERRFSKAKVTELPAAQTPAMAQRRRA